MSNTEKAKALKVISRETFGRYLALTALLSYLYEEGNNEFKNYTKTNKMITVVRKKIITLCNKLKELSDG